MFSLLLTLTLIGCNNSNPETSVKSVETAPEYNHQVFGPVCDPFADLSEDQKTWRIVEIDYPKGPEKVVTPTNFNDVVNPQVVERTMSIYACTNHLHDQRDLLATVMGVGRGHDLSLEGLSYFARTMAYVNLGIDQFATDATSGEYKIRTDQTREIVRRHLAVPANLWSEYHTYKSVLLAGVNKAQTPEPIRAYLHSVIPYFTQPVPQNVLDAERVLITTEAGCKDLDFNTSKGMLCYEKEMAALEALIAITPDYRVLQWMHRRQAEGGQPLVQAWGEILVDFSNSL